MSGEPSLEATADVLSEAAAPTAAPWLTFPPFPTAPQGVPIIPFKDFKPKGILMKIEADSVEHENDEEVDAEGVPTVVLRVKHDLTEAEQSRKKKKRKTVQYVNVNGNTRRPMWYEEWAEGEAFRRTTAINPSASRVDRFHQAAQEFKSTRSWPPSSSGLMGLWDIFRLYVGIISNVQPPQSKKVEQVQRVEDNDEDVDDEEMHFDKKVVVVDAAEAQAKRRVEEELAIAERRASLSEEAKAKIDKRLETKDARMAFFLNEPDMALMIFFSAHYRDAGHLWDRIRCRDGPILVRFFLEFLLRSRVLPESEKQLKKALEVTKIAEKELPLTGAIGMALPDPLNERLLYLFGDMAQRSIWGPTDAEETARFEAEKQKIEDEAKQREQEEKEEEKKRFAEFVAANADGADVEALDPDDPSLQLSEEMQKDAVADNVDQNGVEVQPTSGWGGWGTAEGGDTTAGGWDNADPQDQSWGSADMVRPTLTDLMGPTVLPLTHTTGVIEASTRKLIEVVPPPAPSSKTKKSKKARSPAEAVDEELEQKFGYMVLAPWKKIGNHIKSDIVAPKYLRDSRGPVVAIPVKGEPEKDAEMVEPDSIPPHDAKKDLIRVLITAETVPKLADSIGMGMKATWIQLARRDHSAEGEGEDATGWEKVDVFDRDRKYGGTGVYGAPTKWWYMEGYLGTYPSFHADRQYDDQD